MDFSLVGQTHNLFRTMDSGRSLPANTSTALTTLFLLNFLFPSCCLYVQLGQRYSESAAVDYLAEREFVCAIFKDLPTYCKSISREILPKAVASPSRVAIRENWVLDKEKTERENWFTLSSRTRDCTFRNTVLIRTFWLRFRSFARINSRLGSANQANALRWRYYVLSSWDKARLYAFSIN